MLVEALEERYGATWWQLGRDDRDKRWRALNVMNNALTDATNAELVSAVGVMRWLQEVSEILILAQEVPRWTTAMGFAVWHIYPAMKSKRLTIRQKWAGGVRALKPTMKEETDKLSAGDSKLAISANFVHALDGAHMMMTVLKARDAGITSLRMVHDSFGTHAGDIETLNRVIREGFVEIYSGNSDPLQELYERGLAALGRVNERKRKKLSLDAPPRIGTLDIGQVLHSPYFFC
ncbi:MAG: DNA-directed RNA polymerase [Hyphomicrobium sp.]